MSKTMTRPKTTAPTIDWTDPQMALWIVAQTNIPCCTEGMPGGGKTQGVAGFARALARRMFALIGSAMAPEDIGGLPDIDRTDGVVDMRPMRWAHHAATHLAVILVDELTSCGPDKQAPMLTAIQDKRIGDMHLHPDTIFIAACNPPQIATNGTPLTKPMANRFYHHKWKPHLPAWRAGLRGQEGKALTWAPPAIPVLPADWEKHVSHYAQAVDTFIERNPNCAEGFPEDEETLAFPTLRSWTNLIRALAACRSVNAPGEVMRTVMNGLIGVGTASEFAAWLDHCDLADPEAVLNGEEWVFDIDNSDRGIAFLTALWAAVKAKTTDERWKRAMRITLDTGLIAPEVALLHTETAMDVKPKKLVPDEQMFRDIFTLTSKIKAK